MRAPSDQHSRKQAHSHQPARTDRVKSCGDSSRRTQLESPFPCRSPRVPASAPTRSSRRSAPGGMGEVYRARDARLSRDVAIKVLPASFSADADRLRRFEQEAKAAGVLNHPNITAVYDIGTHEDAPYVVQELLEGETLRSALAGGKLSARKTLDYSLQIVHGLAAAHEKGIVHRDLKPENIFVTNDGRREDPRLRPRQAHAYARSAAQNTNLPTATAGTEPGVVLGTLGYMSPEQVRGKPADARSDIFSFGAILYEMLSGQRAFHGDSAADTMSAILKEDPPDLSVDEPERPAGARAHRPPLPREEPRAALSLRARPRVRPGRALGRVRDGAARRQPPSDAAPATGAGSAIAAMLALLALAAGYALGHRKPADAKSAGITFSQLTFRQEPIFNARFSPDGKTIVYCAAPSGNAPQIYSVRPDFPGTAPTGQPGMALLSISSKGELAVLTRPRYLRHSVFIGTLARMPLEGGAPREIADGVREADWNPDGTELAVTRDVNGKDRLEFPLGKVLAETGGYFSNPRISPRGDRIAFFEHPIKFDDRGSLAVVDLSGQEDGPLRGQRGPGGTRLVQRRKRDPVFRRDLVLRLRDLRDEARREAAQHRPERRRADGARRRPRRPAHREPRRAVEGGSRPRARHRAGAQPRLARVDLRRGADAGQQNVARHRRKQPPWEVLLDRAAPDRRISRGAARRRRRSRHHPRWKARALGDSHGAGAAGGLSDGGRPAAQARARPRQLRDRGVLPRRKARLRLRPRGGTRRALLRPGHRRRQAAPDHAGGNDRRVSCLPTA